MFVEELLDRFTWGGGIVSATGPEEAFKAYTFLREAILDSHLPITKVIGYKIHNQQEKRRGETYISRNPQMGDSYIEIAFNMQDKILFAPPISTIKYPLVCGPVTVDDLNKYSREIRVLCTKPYVCRVLDGNVTLELHIQCSCGYRDMQQNSKVLGKGFFPVNAYFNLNEYVRVAPMLQGETSFRVLYRNGISEKDLLALIRNYIVMIKRSNLSEEELSWVLSFDR